MKMKAKAKTGRKYLKNYLIKYLCPENIHIWKLHF